MPSVVGLPGVVQCLAGCGGLHGEPLGGCCEGKSKHLLKAQMSLSLSGKKNTWKLESQSY